MSKSPSSPEYTLVIAAGEGGTTVPAPGPYQVASGYQTTVRAVPYAGFAFDHWGGDVDSTDPTISVTVTEDTAVIAYFVSTGPSAPASAGGFWIPVLGLLISGVGVLAMVIQTRRVVRRK